MESLGVDHIFIIDDASPHLEFIDSDSIAIISAEKELPVTLSKKINIISFQDHLGRQSGDDYAGWWRSFTYSINIAEKYSFEKIIHIESDFYILSDRLTGFIKTIDQGWTALYSTFYQFPETAIQVICHDSFSHLKEIFKKAITANYRFNNIAELILPFTQVNREFSGDRIGEFPVLHHWASRDGEIFDLDYYGQLPPNIKLMSLSEFKKLISDLKFEINKHTRLNADSIQNILRANDLFLPES